MPHSRRHLFLREVLRSVAAAGLVAVDEAAQPGNRDLGRRSVGDVLARKCLLVHLRAQVTGVDPVDPQVRLLRRDSLQRHYLEPLQRTHYWSDVEFLRRWPGYVKRTQTFFDNDLDLALGSAFVWTRSQHWLPRKWVNWVRLILQAAGPAHWHALRVDLRHLTRALRELLDVVLAVEPGVACADDEPARAGVR